MFLLPYGMYVVLYQVIANIQEQKIYIIYLRRYLLRTLQFAESDKP